MALFFKTWKNNLFVKNKQGIAETETETGESAAFNETTNQIGTQLRPMITILRFLGGYPICETPDKPELDAHYEATISKFSSPGCWFAYTVKAITLFCIISYLCNTALNVPFPFKLFSFGETFLNSASSTTANFNDLSIGTTCVLKLMELVHLFFNTGELVTWLNNWSSFEREFLNCFQKDDFDAEFNFNIRKFEGRVRVIYVALPLLVWLSMGIGFVFLFPMYDFHVVFLGRFVLSTAAFVLYFYTHMEEHKIVVMLKTTVLCQRQIRFNIKEISSMTRGISPTASDVISWRSLINQIRHQSQLSCSYLKVQQILSLADAIISGALGLSFLLAVIGDGDGKFNSVTSSGALVGVVVYCVSSVGKLYFKVLVAEQIPSEERLIADDILELEALCKDDLTKVELKFLYNMLKQDTISVNHGNYFRLDKQLMLQVGMQMVTYLIVIMQFRQSNKQCKMQ